jgi:hypothetical protein
MLAESMTHRKELLLASREGNTQILARLLPECSSHRSKNFESGEVNYRLLIIRTEQLAQ